MRLNGNELVELCNSGSSSVSFSGELSHKASKNGEFKRRHFVLKANCLFVKKTANDSKPSGIILVENYEANLEHTLLGVHAFSISPKCNDSLSARHVFLASSRLDAEQWVHALQRASMSSLRHRLINLRHLILTRTGKDPLKTSNMAILLNGNNLDTDHRESKSKAKSNPKKRDDSTTSSLSTRQRALRVEPSFQSHVPIAKLIDF